MKKIFFTLIPILLLTASCKNKELCMDEPCDPAGWSVLVRLNWESESDARQMRASLFSMNEYPDRDRETINKNGLKTMSLPVGCCYRPICYDYYSKNVYFRNESDWNTIEAYSLSSSRTTYNSHANPVRGEDTVAEPGAFYMDSWDGTFDIEETPAEGEQLVLDFYPKNVMREFTFRINNVSGAKNIAECRGAISGMSSSYFISTKQINPTRSTLLFNNAKAYGGDTGYIEGHFYTFGPVEPYSNRFTIEIISKNNIYIPKSWDVSSQIQESMDDRDAKLARDGYDILIVDDTPDVPNVGKDSGFEIDVGEWNDEVIIYL